MMRVLLVLAFSLSIVSLTVTSLFGREQAVVPAHERRDALARPTEASLAAAAELDRPLLLKHALLPAAGSTRTAARAAASPAAAHPSASSASARDATPSATPAPLLLEPPITPPAPAGSVSLLPLPVGVELVWTRARCASPPHADAAHMAIDDALCALLPEADLASRPAARSCAVVGSSGALVRSGYGPFIDAHDEVFRFNGAPAGAPWARDAGSKTTFSILADVQTRLCVSGRASRPTLRAPRAGASAWQYATEPVRGCEFYARAAGAPPLATIFIPRHNGAAQILQHHHAAKEAAAASARERAGAPIVLVRADSFAAHVDAQIDAYAKGTSHPTSGFNGVVAALALCASVDLYGFGTPREHYYSPERAERKGAQHLYRTEYAWFADLERRFPGRVRVWR